MYGSVHQAADHGSSCIVDHRREIAAELLRLTEGSHLFDEAATFGDDSSVAFDLGESQALSSFH